MFRANAIKLHRKLGPFTELPPYVPPLNELFALLAGVKPVLFDTVQPEDMGELRRVCEGLKLRVRAFRDRTLGAGRVFALIGKEPALLEKALRAYRRQEKAYAEWGAALGYPPCCVESLRTWSEARLERGYSPDIVEFVYDRTPRRARLPFYTNNVFNYFSRPGRLASPGYDEKDRFYGLAVNRLNTGLKFSLLPVISWHPCSYLCAESLKKALAIFGLMSHHAPEFAAQRKEVLSKPVFFVDKYAFAVLDGAPRGGAVNYRGLFPVHSLLGRNYRALLEKNTCISRSGELVKVGGRTLKPAFPFSKAPLLLPFSSG